MTQTNITEQIPAFTTKNYGPSDAWADFLISHPRLGKVPGKQLLRAELGLTGMEISLNSLPPGKAAPFVHGHRKNEELYLFLSGSGQFLADDQIVEVSAGTAIRVAPPVLRCWRNTGREPLAYVVIQAQADSLSQATAHDGFISETPASWPSAPSASRAE